MPRPDSPCLSVETRRYETHFPLCLAISLSVANDLITVRCFYKAVTTREVLRPRHNNPHPSGLSGPPRPPLVAPFPALGRVGPCARSAATLATLLDADYPPPASVEYGRARNQRIAGLPASSCAPVRRPGTTVACYFAATRPIHLALCGSSISSSAVGCSKRCARSLTDRVSWLEMA
jgi:hypothetical protein